MRHPVGTKERFAELLDQGWGYRAAASMLGLSHSTAQSWAYTHRAFGKDVLLMRNPRSTYSFETKLAVVRDHLEGKLSRNEIMEKHGIRSAGQVGSWTRLYLKGGPDALKPKKRGPKPPPPPDGLTREQELEGRVRELELELEVQKRLNALLDARRQM